MDFGLIDDGLTLGHEKGTILIFHQTKESIRNSEAHIKKLLAMSFKFSLLDDGFTIHVNGEPVTIDNLKDLMNATEFLWNINQYEDDYISGLPALKERPQVLTTALDLKGFTATVSKPSQLKIQGTEERATIDLFVNGRLRERNILRHVPSQRIVESYMYGQIHFDAMDQGGKDPFTSSREGVVDEDENFKNLLDYLKREVLPKIIDEWDKLRLKHRKEGDAENTERKSKRQRMAIALYSAASEEYSPRDDAPRKGQVEEWVAGLQDDAEFNISAYVDCFLSENLVRKFIHEQNIDLSDETNKEIERLQKAERKAKSNAGISFSVRKGDDPLSYLGMDTLACQAEGRKSSDSTPSLWNDARRFKPVRNAVSHTGLLTDTAKRHLRVTFENIKARVNHLISK